jgi:hypothetical protein
MEHLAAMNKIDKNELYNNLSDFLKNRGVLLQDGSYSRALQKSCEVLADTINLSQQAMDRAKTEIEQRLDKVREAIHRKTAPGKSSAQQQGAKRDEPAAAKSRRRAWEAKKSKTPKKTKRPRTSAAQDEIPPKL